MRRLLPLALFGLVACSAPPPSVPSTIGPPAPVRTATPRPFPSSTPDVIGERDLLLQTAVGSGTAGFAGDGGPPQEARLNTPTGLAINRGDLLIADQANHRIRRLTYDGELETYVGTGTPGFNGDGAALTQLQLNSPYKILSDDATGLIFIADRGNGLIRCIDPSDRLITVAGGGQTTLTNGGAAVSGLDAKLDGVAGMAIDSSGHLYITESSGNRILRLNVDHEWQISVYAGTGTAGFGGDGGNALQARFNQPVDLAIDAQDNLYVADMGNHRIRKISPEGVVSTLAGNGLPGFFGDGRPAEEASLNLPSAVASDNQGNIFLADSGNQRIRGVRPDGAIVTLAGTGTAGYSGDGGLPGLGTFNAPWAIAYSPTGGLYVADRDNHAIRHFNVP